MVCCCVHITAVVTCIENANSSSQPKMKVERNNQCWTFWESKSSRLCWIPVWLRLWKHQEIQRSQEIDFRISRFQGFQISIFSWFQEEESVRFRGHQAEVAMITITACSYLTLGDPPQQPGWPLTPQQQPKISSFSRQLQVICPTIPDWPLRSNCWKQNG